MSLRKKSSEACIGMLETLSLKNYSLLENSLGISLWHAKNPIFIMGDKKTLFYYLLFFLKSKSELRDLIAVDASGKLWQYIYCSDLDSNFIICQTCLETVQFLLTENFLL